MMRRVLPGLKIIIFLQQETNLKQYYKKYEYYSRLNDTTIHVPTLGLYRFILARLRFNKLIFACLL